ncbi:hypothetical protein ACFQ71_34085 [Streptomyces sp. NPDC056534]|uniref:terpene synthase family protein n=1 Tax=Streptomyces sp. NPDC056534 TaxID=3345857 RepID=UPI00367595B9
MPQEISLHFPFEPRRSPDSSRASRSNLQWLREFGLVTSKEALTRYASWDLSDLAARAYPDALGEDLGLALDTMSFFFLFDDQFDGPVGNLPDITAEVCDELSRIVHLDLDASAAYGSPVTRSFADIWARARLGMPQDWKERASRNWHEYFVAHIEEAANRQSRRRLSEEEYLRLRRATVGVLPSIDLAQRVQNFRVPERIACNHAMASLSEIATDTIALGNDIFSAEKEAAQNDPHNIVLIIQSMSELSRESAIAAIAGRIEDKVEFFESIVTQLPETLQPLAPSQTEQEHVRRFVLGLRDWMRASYDWQAKSHRYTTSVDASNETSFFEDLLSSSTHSGYATAGECEG